MATSVLHPKDEGSRTYSYSSHPRTVPQRKKYRDQAYGNIMHDRRIVRGNTYALHTLPASTQPDPLELQRQQESRRRALARRRAREGLRPLSPEPVEGRRHVDVQTELYLEEITDRVEEADVATQTNAFLDRPPTPLFVPAKTGVDAATQIEEGDLFNFDLEVRPILEVLVGKTVEQALLEVMEEEELASLRAQQRQFEENRNAEVVETQRLEEQERRRREEKDRRMQQQRLALLKEKETAEKVAARAFAQSYLGDLVTSVFSSLHEGGFFYDPVEREVEIEFMPWLLDEAEKTLDKKILARALLDSIIRDVVMKQLGIEPPEPQLSPSPKDETPPTATPPSADQTGGQEGEEKVDPKPPETEAKPTEEQVTASEGDRPAEPDAVPVAPETGDQPPAEAGEEKEAKGEEDPPNKEGEEGEKGETKEEDKPPAPPEPEKVGEEEPEKEKVGEEEAEKEKVGEGEPEKEKVGEEEAEKEKVGEEEPEKEKAGEGEPEKEKAGEGEPEKEKVGEEEPEKEKVGEGEPEKEKVGEEEAEKEKVGEEEAEKEKVGEGEPDKVEEEAEMKKGEEEGDTTQEGGEEGGDKAKTDEPPTEGQAP